MSHPIGTHRQAEEEVEGEIPKQIEDGGGVPEPEEGEGGGGMAGGGTGTTTHRPHSLGGWVQKQEQQYTEKHSITTYQTV